MRTLVAGARGLIGSAVAAHLASQGHEVVRLLSRPPGTRTIDIPAVEPFAGGAHVASAPWPAHG